MVELILMISCGIAGIGILLLGARMLKGPTIADRTVALDVMTIISTAIICALAVLYQRSIYIDVALVYALISFLGVVSIARFLEKGL